MDMNICASANSKYLRYLYVMLLSLLETNSGNNISVYIFQRDFADNDKYCINSLFRSYEQKVEFIYIDEDRFAKFPEKFRYTLEVYFRLEILSKIPNRIKRILYLDVDMIIRKDLSYLFEIALDGYYFAACLDMIAGSLLPEQRVLFNRFDDLRYFNSGMMVWNLQELRRDGITFEDFYKAADELGFDLPLVDQDILNYKFYDKVLYLDAEKYNYMVTKFIRDGWNESDINIDASILHFTGVSPWGEGPKAPIYKIWWEYAKKSPFYVELLEEQLERTEKYIFDKQNGATLPNQRGFIMKQCTYMMLMLKGNGVIKQTIVSSKRRWVLWGAGYLGKCFFDILHFENCSGYIDAIIDNRIVQKMGEIPIYHDLSWIDKDVNYTIIITPSYDFDRIKSQIASLDNNNIYSITLLDFLAKLFNTYKTEHRLFSTVR